jgi:hypothetical protein
MRLRRGEPQDAWTWFDLAQRIATRHGLTRWQGPALHDLFLCARDAGDVKEARRLAQEAWAAYGERHPRVGAFLADWIGLSLPPERWDPYFRPFVLPDVEPSDRVAALACLLRSAAARRDRLRAAEAWHRLRDAAGEDVAGAALALADAAEALDRSGLRDAAEAAAERARELAEIRKEGRVRERAERTLSRLRSAPVESAAATT